MSKNEENFHYYPDSPEYSILTPISVSTKLRKKIMSYESDSDDESNVRSSEEDQE